MTVNKQTYTEKNFRQQLNDYLNGNLKQYKIEEFLNYVLNYCLNQDYTNIYHEAIEKVQ